MKDLAPLLNVEKLSSEFNISESEMYVLIINNFDELENFLTNLKFIKDNQNVLDSNPIHEVEEKKRILKPLELKSINLYSKILQIDESLENLSSKYSNSVASLNEKFAFYNELFSRIESKMS